MDNYVLELSNLVLNPQSLEKPGPGPGNKNMINIKRQQPQNDRKSFINNSKIRFARVHCRDLLLKHVRTISKDCGATVAFLSILFAIPGRGPEILIGLGIIRQAASFGSGHRCRKDLAKTEA